MYARRSCRRWAVNSHRYHFRSWDRGRVSASICRRPVNESPQTTRFSLELRYLARFKYIFVYAQNWLSSSRIATRITIFARRVRKFSLSGRLLHSCHPTMLLAAVRLTKCVPYNLLRDQRFIVSSISNFVSSTSHHYWNIKTYRTYKIARATDTTRGHIFEIYTYNIGILRVLNYGEAQKVGRPWPTFAKASKGAGLSL